MTIGTQIANLRKKCGLTQEGLAQKLGITNQAVSKWESEQCCPDVMLLPKLADTFGVSLDELFGRKAPKQEAPVSLPWADDDTLRAVAFVGRRLVEEHPAAEKITLHYSGEVRNIDSAFSVTCGDVEGNVTAGSSVHCGDIAGPVAAGGNVNCGEIFGALKAGGNVKCGDVNGDVTAGGMASCGDVSGSVHSAKEVMTRMCKDMEPGEN